MKEWEQLVDLRRRRRNLGFTDMPVDLDLSEDKRAAFRATCHWLTEATGLTVPELARAGIAVLGVHLQKLYAEVFDPTELRLIGALTDERIQLRRAIMRALAFHAAPTEAHGRLAVPGCTLSDIWMDLRQSWIGSDETFRPAVEAELQDLETECVLHRRGAEIVMGPPPPDGVDPW